jgi:hypothetical protein
MTWNLKTEDIPAHVRYAHEMGRGMLIPQQIDELVKAINPAFVEAKQSKTYLAQHQARAEMNRIFGYANWDGVAERMDLMYEYQEPGTGANASKTYWVTGYRCFYRVVVRDLWGMPLAEYGEWHAEENAKLPNRGEAHAFALTSVESYALRRALINLGDRFGLGLYDDGKTSIHGGYTIQQPGMNGAVGALYSWEWLDDAAPAQQAPQPPAEAQAAPRQTAAQKRMETFNGVQQKMQADREAQRDGAISPEMQARLQQGLKVDAAGADFGPGYGED